MPALSQRHRLGGSARGDIRAKEVGSGDVDAFAEQLVQLAAQPDEW